MSEFLAKDHLPRVSHQSVNDKGDNEMIPGAVHRSPGIYLTVRKPSDKGCATSYRLKWDPSPSNEIGRIAQHGGRAGMKEGMDYPETRCKSL